MHKYDCVFFGVPAEFTHLVPPVNGEGWVGQRRLRSKAEKRLYVTVFKK